jgi:hypothetical protein
MLIMLCYKHLMLKIYFLDCCFLALLKLKIVLRCSIFISTKLQSFMVLLGLAKFTRKPSRCCPKTPLETCVYASQTWRRSWEKLTELESFTLTAAKCATPE